mgnify:CR=1 FL=1|jgi:zona occludens toxin
MITCFTGTGGTGKSLDAASIIYQTLTITDENVIANFAVNYDIVKYGWKQYKKYRDDKSFVPTPQIKKSSGHFYYVDNQYLSPDFLYSFAAKFHVPRRESQTLVVLDECQNDKLFGNRSWNNKNRQDWCHFFEVHRHFGFDIILIAPSIKLIDKAIQYDIEYEDVHRKLSRFGWRGRIVQLLSGGCQFAAIRIWRTIGEKESSRLFRYSEMYSEFYDSFRNF